ncbi:hypothetical protein AD933_01675, partial [Acetobacter malorum]
MIADDKPLHTKAFAQDLAHERGEPVRAGLGRILIVVMGDEAAERNAGMSVQEREYGIEHGTTDILEIDIDPFRAGSSQLCGEVGCTMIDTGIKSQCLDADFSHL